MTALKAVVLAFGLWAIGHEVTWWWIRNKDSLPRVRIPRLHFDSDRDLVQCTNQGRLSGAQATADGPLPRCRGLAEGGG